MTTPPSRPTERTTEDRERNAVSKLLEEGSKLLFDAIPYGDIHIAMAMEDLAHILLEESRRRRIRIETSTHGPPPIQPRPYTERGELASAAPVSHSAEEVQFPPPARIPADLRPPIALRDFTPTDALPTARKAETPAVPNHSEAASTDPPAPKP